MKLFYVLGTPFLVLPIFLVAGQSQNETYIAEEIAKIPACGVGSRSLAENKM
jgi:hypothetical protein